MQFGESNSVTREIFRVTDFTFEICFQFKIINDPSCSVDYLAMKIFYLFTVLLVVVQSEFDDSYSDSDPPTTSRKVQKSFKNDGGSLPRRRTSVSDENSIRSIPSRKDVGKLHSNSDYAKNIAFLVSLSGFFSQSREALRKLNDEKLEAELKILENNFNDKTMIAKLLDQRLTTADLESLLAFASTLLQNYNGKYDDVESKIARTWANNVVSKEPSSNSKPSPVRDDTPYKQSSISHRFPPPSSAFYEDTSNNDAVVSKRTKIEILDDTIEMMTRKAESIARLMENLEVLSQKRFESSK